MKAPLNKRAKAWLIDIIIITIILFLVSIIYHPSIIKQKAQMDSITLSYASKNINFTDYIKQMSPIYHKIDTINFVKIIIDTVVLTIYFIIIPYYKNGQTIGKKITALKVKQTSNQKLKLTSLIIRNLIINGLLYEILLIVCILIISPNIYYPLISILAFIQIILVLSSMIMVTYRKDKKGLHDLLAHTWVCKER